jgi:hypothetical protein
MVDDSSTAPMHLTSELAPDLGLVERFIRTKFAEGALALLLASVMALLTRMSKLNTELMRQVALGRRKRPPSERMHRLQLELPLWGAVQDNDAQPPKRKPPRSAGRATRVHTGAPSSRASGGRGAQALGRAGQMHLPVLQCRHCAREVRAQRAARHRAWRASSCGKIGWRCVRASDAMTSRDGTAARRHR